MSDRPSELIGPEDVQGAIELILAEKLGIQVPDRRYDLVASGLLDSLALVNLLAELESGLGVRIDIEQLEPEDLESIVSIAGMVERARG
jgi:acyl carrier protein